ncbi:MAG: Gfo/Idh/MocA family protein, partial [Flavobacteriales bacterium]
MHLPEAEKVRFAVVGCGHVGKRHAGMIARNPECELAALCDISPPERLGLGDLRAPFFNDMSAMLEAVHGIDVVSICTPNGLHAEQTIAALQARRHVVVEKPMGITKASCEEVLQKALLVNRVVFVVMQNRYSPPSQWLKGILGQGLLGDIHVVQVNCYWNRDERYYRPGSWKGTARLDGGTLFTQFSHFIDMMFWL